MQAIADIAIRNDLVVLADEAYFDIRYRGVSTSIASLPDMAQRTVILYTFSKKFAMTGWRFGTTIGPKEIVDCVAKINVNDESCSNHFIQYGAVEGLQGIPPVRGRSSKRCDRAAIGLSSCSTRSTASDVTDPKQRSTSFPT